MQTAAIATVGSVLVDRPLETVLEGLGPLSTELVHDSQLRWLGPEKGVIHMAIAAMVNALWDLRAKRAGQPLRQSLSCLSRLHHHPWLAGLQRRQARPALPGGSRRRVHPDQTEGGWGPRRRPQADAHRTRAAVGPKVRIAIDANQRWDVGVAIGWVRELAEFDPWSVEEPTSPDDVLGIAAIAARIAPIKVATGEHVPNRIVFKQMLQTGALAYLQIDAARVGGVNENIAILLLAAKFGVPVCPHAGGVGLCELVQHLSMFDVVAVSASTENRVIEYVDHLHDHFVDPAVVERGRYRVPTAPGMGAAMHPQTLADYRYPDGAVWAADPQGVA